MALKLLWTPNAVVSFDKIITYLEEHWTEKEVRHFIEIVKRFTEVT